MKHKKNLITACVVSACFLLVGCNSSQDGAGTQGPPAIPVVAIPPEVKDLTLYIDVLGTLQPAVQMEVPSRTSGTLLQSFVKEGQTVEKNVPLFAIDHQPYQIKVQEAEAQLAMDVANHKGVLKKLERFRELAEKDLIARTEWEDLEAQVEKAHAAIDLDQARVSAAKLDLEHCTIRSPISGRIGKIDTHPGALIAKGKALVTLSKIDSLLVEFYVTEKEFAKIPKQELSIEMKTLCSTDVCQQGKVTFLDNHFDAQTGLLLMRGILQNSDYALRPGQHVHVRVPIGVAASAILIPQKAIRYNQQGPYAYVVQPDMTVAIRPLILGKEEGLHQIVLQGLDKNETVILEGHLRLSPGLKVSL